MGLFSRRKEIAEKKQGSFSIPQFHEEFPKYESTITHEDLDNIKEAIAPSERPKPPKMTFATIPIKESQDFSQQEVPQKRMIFEDYKPERTERLSSSLPFAAELQPKRQERPMFIKIERYNESIEKIEQIKTQLEELNRVLAKMNEIKAEEDAELNFFNTEISSIKESLNSIDRMLFGK